jgi:hypothetical protein
MTEAEWQSSTDADALFHHLRWWVRPPERKYRLFACGVCRQCWRRLSDLGRHAVALAEAAADGQPVDDRPGVEYDLLNEHTALRVQRVPLPHPTPEEQASLIAYAVIGSGGGGVEAADDAIRNVPDEAVPLADLLRDIFGNPFGSATFLAEWRTETVVALARGIYAERAFDRMPVLADALQDAGCEDKAILTHCRGAGPHVRGCWVVDAVVGKS